MTMFASLLADPIETERLRLRRLTLADAAAFHAMTDDPAIIEAIDFLRAPFEVADAEALIKGRGDGTDCFWGIWPRERGTLIGTIGAHVRGSDEIEIGYWLASLFHGRGFVGEAARAIIAALASAFPRHRIYAECRPDNAASWKLLEKIGFRADGRAGQRAGRARLVYARANLTA